ncbi:MAG TPA: histidine kinase [Chryseolinea sp.]|nr:histidine kinase [Chryseolinea sp.]
MARFDAVIDDMMPTFRSQAVVLLVSCTLGMLMFAYLHFSETNYFPLFTERSSGFICSGVIGGLIGMCLFFVNRLLDRWIPWRSFFTPRFITGYIVDLIVALILSFSLASFSVYLFGNNVFWQDYTPSDEDLNIKLGILLSATTFIYTVIYALLYSYQQYAVAQLEKLQRERKQMELQFEALKSQLSPHYLFNSLNTISSLIYKDTPSAEQFVRRLSQTYQYILSTQHKRYVTLREEVDFVQSYYYLLRIRFQQQLNLEVNLPSSILNSRIPPLTLQILVENAVKHNIMTMDQRLYIYITAQDNTYLKVINTKTGNLKNVTSFRLGLENIKKRYEFFTDKRIEIRDDEKFSVMLPVILDRHAESEGDVKHPAYA